MRSLVAVPSATRKRMAPLARRAAASARVAQSSPGVRRDAQAADRLVELLRLLPPRVVARTLEQDFEFGGNLSYAVFEKLARAKRHC